MNRTVPWGRDADAAQPSRSSEGYPDHTAEMRAIALQLERLSSSVAGRGEADGPPDAHGTPRAGADRLGALREAVAAIARRQADLDGSPAERGGRADIEANDSPTLEATPRPGADAPHEQPPSAAARPVPAQVAAVPSDEPVAPSASAFAARPAPAEVVRASPTPTSPATMFPASMAGREPSGLRRAGIDLTSEVSQTFARFSRDLHDAIRSTDARPRVDALGQEVRQIGRAVDSLGARSPDAETLARIGEQTREMRDLLKASTSRTLPFDAVERQVASLESRLGRLAAMPMPEPSPAPAGASAPVPGFGDTMAEVRALLGGFDPGASMAALETRLDAITERIDRGLDARGPSGLIEGLSRRVDEIHASLRSQLAEAAVDTRPLEGLVRGLSERIGQARDASADFHGLEAAVRDVGAKIDGAAAGLDPRGVQAVEAQLARLGERLDRSEASLRALDGVEHTLGELFSQFEVTRQVAIDAAETAARTAARDTLRAALQNPGLAPRAPDASSAAVDQMARSLDDIRALQDTAERRTQSALSDIQVAMDRLIGQMAASGVAPAAAVASGSAHRAAPADGVRRSRAAPAPALAAAPPAALDPADQMIEPGLGGAFGAARGPAGQNLQTARAEIQADPRPEPGFMAEPAAPALPPAADGDGPASFIAAARRAAQAAQASAASDAAARAADRRSAARSAARSSEPRRRAPADAAEAGTLSRARAFLSQRRRPILLSLAALVLLVGALEVVNLSADPMAANRVSEAPARTRLASTAAGLDAGRASDKASDKVSDKASDKVSDMPKAVLPPAAAAAPAPLPSFVTGQSRAPAPVEGIPEGLRTAAAAGDAAAQYEVGLRYSEGRGTARDPKQAAAWFGKAAASGLPPAEYRLGSAYEKGAGVDRDPALATGWYGKAAEAGNIRAMHNLAVMSADGAGGKPDYAKAAQWFGKASTYGVRDSQFNLAILYARGLGIEQSLPQSYTWFAIAAAGGDEDAGKKRDEVAGKLDAKALASAKAAAEAFHAAVPPAAANDVAPPPGGWDAAPARAPGASPAANARISQL